MFTIVIVATLVVLLALTAFVPKVQTVMKWLFKKSALVVNFLIVGLIYTVVELLLLVGLLIMGTIQCVGRVLTAIGNWGLGKLDAGDARATKRFRRELSNAIKRFG